MTLISQKFPSPRLCRSLLLLVVGSTVHPLHAQPLYFENFDADPGYVVATGTDANNISSVAFGAAGSGFPTLSAGQFGGTGQYLSGATIPSSTSGGALVLGSDQRIHDKARNRSTVTFIDTSAAQVGQYRVAFDVRDFQVTDNDTKLRVHLYEGSVSGKGYVAFQVTQQKALPEKVSPTPLVKTGNGGVAWRSITDQPINGNGRTSLNFGLTLAGKPGSYLALVWSQVKQGGSAVLPSMTLDNIEVAMLPAPDMAGVITTPDAEGPSGPKGDWALVESLSDEFNTATVDPTRWNSNPGSWGAWGWDESNAYQKDGNLLLRMVHEPHQRESVNLFYKSGILRSHQQTTYGYYEARIKGCGLFPGACPAFWMYSDGRQSTGEVRYCEIDFVELQMNEMNHETKERDSVHHIDMNLHLRLANPDGTLRWVRPLMNPELCANAWVAPWDPRDDFHVYGTDVTPETITWYIDGKEVAKKPNKYWHLPMNLTLSLGLRHPHIGWVGQDIKPIPQAATAEGFPTEMEVDWVRVWQRK